MNNIVKMIDRIFWTLLLSGIVCFLGKSELSGQEKLLKSKTLPCPLQYELVGTVRHDSSAYCQGLAYEFDPLLNEEVLFESTGQYGRSQLKKTLVQSGKTLQKVDLPNQFFGEGMVIVDQKIYQLTWKERTCLVYDKESFQTIDEFRYFCDGWGLTFDGEHLLLSDGSEKIRFFQPENFRLQKTLNVFYLDSKGKKRPLKNLNELEWIEGEIWANVYYTTMIARIDPETGKVIEFLNFKKLLPPKLDNPDFVLNGIAYDPKTRRVFLTGKCWPTLYIIQIKE